ncbi:alanine racemase [Actinomadura barringtoniae]|uniref:alanine racemase n=1 Tax=Actinomadura barringtoniae TaxID=1427535 RepID=UPI001FB57AA2|nr:alanine racemase [Actinomadura barringtoniae]
MGSPPFGFLDLQALRANAEELVVQAKGKPLRVATKSIRCLPVLDELLAMGAFRGVLALTLGEALMLDRLGYRDVVVGYPTADREALSLLVANAAACTNITLMFDSPDQLDLVDSVAPPRSRPVLRACLELDASLRVGPAHFGARRSPLFRPAELRDFARQVVDRPGYAPVGIMAYEGQVAGVYDAGRSPRAVAVRAMQRLSKRELRPRRAAAIRAVREVFEPEFVNGGGTGSVGFTADDPAVTEIAAGSGIYAPGLFTRYRNLPLSPAAFFACPVVRKPRADIATVSGGGWVASGTPGADRLPTIAYPEGLSFVANESAGEAQTPLHGDAARGLAVGDLVIFRHAKAGELCERVNELLVIDGECVADRWQTYRGRGVALQ